MSIPLSELQNLNPDAIIELFKLDLTPISGDAYYFHAGTNELNGNVVWQGQTYTRFPIEVTGFEASGSGSLPRLSIKASNIMSAITALALAHDDLIGAVLTRKRTLKQYLDAANFTGGVNPSADPDSYFPDDVFVIERKVTENRTFVEFEAVSKIDLHGKKLPAGQILQNACRWAYRGAECGYNGTNYFNKNDNAVANSSEDVCAKRLSSCKARFGENAVLPFGAYPGAGLVRG